MPLDLRLIKDGNALNDFLAALVAPLQTSTDSLHVFSDLYLKRSKINGQKMILQAGLNDLFGVLIAPFILVETADSGASNVYVFEPSELIPLYVSEVSENDPVYLWQGSEPVAEADFVVKIPTAIHTAELERQIAAETNLFKLAGKTFTIETY